MKKFVNFGKGVDMVNPVKETQIEKKFNEAK